ncbi:conserved hypothetical protein [Perkinsus marinus ATCC 50983]|uniref:PIN domain-containing protein n=1 Tax=Perkinsus marinus (strain ATCC 50983 / TXsc) TaxID=423536 RepID=C5K700_PERM5|nr:conserved hypothetical protein [Perkinsus marinus ATCC 50983]EER19745.1 conserved hypothetical protein [Perkinsus marinus ATCC 50983]|eukprot:XP_002787949.1 conserved hypothetical protein [Perkinsus marinus ATCC 50983]
MFFEANNNHTKTPYQVLVDTNFFNFSIQNKLDPIQALTDCLLAKAAPCVTDCVIAEMEKLALRLAKDPRFTRLTCDHHTGTYADDCLVTRIPEGGPQPTKQLSVKQIISIHEFMLQQLDRIVTEFSAIPESVRAKFDMKTVTIAAQAIVGSAVEKKFSVSSDDIESAVMLNHAQLSVSQQFANINIKMQETMTKLMDEVYIH